ncbi:MAG: hypothetical protein K5919_10305 [Clostridiales bacterium]|nr:hypothetical protein [Clostridiales bacterium]
MSASALTSPGRHLSLAGEITDLTGAVLAFGPERVFAFSLSEGSADGRLLGGPFSAVCSVTLDDRDGAFTALHDLWSASVRVSLCAGEETWPLCVFTAARVRRQEGRLTLSGSDALGTAFDGVFEDDLSYPRTLGSLAAAVASRAGFTLTADFPGASFAIPERPRWGEITLRQALAHIACACGCFVLIDRAGALAFRPVWPDAAPFSLGADQTLKTEAEGTAFGPMAGLWVYPANAPQGAEPLTVSEPGAVLGETNSLAVSENPLFPYQGSHTQALAQQLLGFLSGMRLRRVRVSWRGDPLLTVGRRLRIAAASGEVIDCLVTGQTLSFLRGFSMQTDCLYPGRAAAAGRIFTAGGTLNAARLSGSLDGVLIRDGTVAARALIAGTITAQQLAAASITAEKIAAGAVTAAKIATGAVTADKIAAGAITAAKIAAGAVTAEKIAAHTITAGLLAAGLITADSGLIATGAIGTAQIADGSITDAKIVGLTASKITAGTIDASVVYINNLTADNITTGTLNGARIPVLGTEKLADGAVTGDKVAQNAVTADKIVAGAVTAAKIASAAVTTNKLAANAVTAAKIDVADLFAAQATINALNAMDIRGNQYLRLVVNRSFSQWADPALTASNAIQDGDIWNKDNHIRTWTDAGTLTWEQAGALGYTWDDMKSGRQYIRRNGAWEPMNDPTKKYDIVSGIEILPQGVEISGGKYVRIRSGGVFKVDSGNFSIDSAGNVKMKGTVEAAAGKIGGWTIGADKLSSGDGTNYVQMAVSGDYAFLAGNETESSAPFRVKRDGTVYLTKLVALNEQGGETTVNLQNYPFWKLGYHTIKSYNANGITLSNGATINFNTAAQLIIEGSWSGMTFIATVKNGNNETVMSTSESFSGGKGTGSQSTGSIYTINEFDNTHKAHGYVNASPHFQPQRLFTFNVDAAGVYKAGWDAALAMIELDGNVIKGPGEDVDTQEALYTVTVNGWVNSIVNNAPGYYTASGEAHAYIDGADVASAGFTKTVHFS